METFLGDLINLFTKVIQNIDVDEIFLSIQFSLVDIFSAYKSFVLLQFPHANLCIVASNAINAATTVYSLQAKNEGKKLYWLHSLILVVITGFGGGIVGPLLIAKPSVIVANDSIFTMCFLWWYITHHISGSYAVLCSTLFRIPWTIGLGLFRTSAVIGTLMLTT